MNEWVSRTWFCHDGIERSEWVFNALDAHMFVYPVPLDYKFYRAYLHYTPDPAIFWKHEDFDGSHFLTATEAQAWCIRRLALCRSERAALDVSVPA